MEPHRAAGVHRGARCHCRAGAGAAGAARAPAPENQLEQGVLDDRRLGRGSLFYRRLAAAGWPSARLLSPTPASSPRSMWSSRRSSPGAGAARCPARSCGRRWPCRPSAPGCSAAARLPHSPKETSWWRCRRCSGRRTWSSRAGLPSTAGRSPSPRCSLPWWVRWPRSAALLLETTTLEGLRGAAVDIAYVGLLSSALTFTLLTVALQHTPALGSGRDREHWKPCSPRWPLTCCWASAWRRSAGPVPRLILAATLLLQLGTALSARWQRTRVPRPGGDSR